MVGIEAATVAVVDALRSDPDVSDALYVDTTTPSNADDRDRVYVGAATRQNEHPVEVAVMPIADSSSTSLQTVTAMIAFECVAVATEAWYKEQQSLRLLRILDTIDDVNHLAPTANLAGQGRAGGTSGGAGIDVEADTGRRAIGGRWVFRTSESRY